MEPSPENEVRSRIAQHGRITFAEFMEVVLYHPAGGYYPGGRERELESDFYTSPAAHPAFGALLGIYLSELWEAIGRPSPFLVVEMGAGSGLLARDILDYAPNASDGFDRALRYVALDRSRPRFLPAGSDRLLADGLPLSGVTGCILSNELLDAFPIHRFQIEDGSLAEVYVTIEDGELVERLDEPSTPLVAERLGGRVSKLPDGYKGEVSLGITDWVAGVASALDCGFVITIDYGYEADELYAPERKFGTLETYFKHTKGSSPYQRIGRQDITAHVDFSAVIEAGEAVGLKPVLLNAQADFLLALGLGRWLYDLGTQDISAQERQANVVGLRELVKPEGLGRFKVLVQEKGTGTSDLDAAAPAEPSNALPLPLLTPDHMPLVEGRYPSGYIELEQLWPWGEE